MAIEGKRRDLTSGSGSCGHLSTTHARSDWARVTPSRFAQGTCWPEKHPLGCSVANQGGAEACLGGIIQPCVGVLRAGAG